MNELRNCLTCNFSDWRGDFKEHGECQYPIPSCYKKYPLVRGLFTTCVSDRNGRVISTHVKDRSRVGYKMEDGSVIEIKDCWAWEKKEPPHDEKWLINALLQQVRILTEIAEPSNSETAAIIKDIENFREKLEGFGYGTDPF